MLWQQRKEEIAQHKQLERMTENFEVSKQILKQTLEVKLHYQRIIQKTMSVKELRQGIKKIIKQENAKISNRTNNKEE